MLRPVLFSALFILVASQGAWVTPPPTSPLPRGSGELAAGEYPKAPTNFYVFGGVIDQPTTDSSNWPFFNDLWRCQVLPAAGNSFNCLWLKLGIGSSGVEPSARAFASTAVLRRSFLSTEVAVYGGGLIDSSGTFTPATDSFYIYSFFSKWEDKTSTVPAALGARIATASASYEEKFFVFGGFNGAMAFSDLWQYSAQTGAWTLLFDPPTSKRSVPLASHFIDAEIRKTLFGKLEEVHFAQTTKRDGAAACPTDRFGAALETTNDGDTLWLYSGISISTSGVVIEGDVWEFDFGTSTWSLQYGPLDPGAIVSPRIYGGTASSKDGNTVLLYGGEAGGSNPQNPRNELFSWDVASETWTEIVQSGSQPPMLKRTSAVNAGDEFYVVGGYDINPNGTNQLFTEQLFRTDFD